MIHLKNDCLHVEIENPFEGYAGSRFDKFGKVVQIVDLHGNKYCTSERLNSENLTMLGKGLYGEFGIDMPIGYEECNIGDFFPKIGVGMLKKVSSDPYDFFYNYEQIPFATEVEQISNSEVSFKSVCSDDKYPFIYRKKVSLIDHAIHIDYQFINSGISTICTNEYIHNFISFNGDGANEKLTLDFKNSINLTSYAAGLNPKGILRLDPLESNTAQFIATPNSDFFFDNLVDSPALCNTWCLSSSDNLSVSELVDFRVDKVNLWGAAHVVSPELFNKITVHPNESVNWRRIFEFKTNIM